MRDVEPDRSANLAAQSAVVSLRQAGDAISFFPIETEGDPRVIRGGA
ncbi:MAG: hypothetical protein ACR2ND_14385 [Solirubrobacteraceae bacterium]